MELVGGTPCIVDTTAATEVAAVGFWYDRGSRDEAPGERGSTHFIEHMLFKGTRRRAAFDIAREIDRLGGSINAFTERESMSVFAVVPEDGFEKTVEIMLDMTGDSLFDTEEFERERTVIENELSAADDDPEEAAADAFADLVWKNHPLGLKIGGTAADVASLSRDSVFESYRAHYAGAVDIMTVAGDVSGERVSAALAGVFPIPKQKPARKSPEWPPATGAYYSSAPFQHVQVFCSFQLPGKLSSTEYYALQAANTAMGDSMSSRLFQSLRERQGLCYSIYSAPTLLSDATLWTVFASSTVDTLPALLEGIGEELERFRDSGSFGAEETQDAVAQIRGGMKLEATDVEHRMRRLARQTAYGSAPISVSEASERIAAVGREAAGRSLLDFFDRSSPLVFAFGPAKAKSRFMAAAGTIMRRLGTVDAAPTTQR